MDDTTTTSRAMYREYNFKFDIHKTSAPNLARRPISINAVGSSDCELSTAAQGFHLVTINESLSQLKKANVIFSNCDKVKISDGSYYTSC